MRATLNIAKLTMMLVLLVPTVSFSEEDTKLDFNTSGTVKPEFKKGIQFKAPDDDKKLDLVKDAENKNLFTTPIEYPKTELYFSFNPGVDGFTDTLSSSRIYNYGGTNLTGMSLGLVYNPSIENYLTIDGSFESIAIPAFSDTSAGLLVAESTAAILDFSMGFNMCWIFESTYHRLCPGIQLDYDSFPTLSFPQSSNSQINLQTVHDMSLGLNLAYSHHLGQNFQFLTKLIYNYGLGMGQSSNLGTKSDQKISGRIGIEKPISNQWYWNLIFGMDYRTATLQSAQDTWKIENLSYNSRIGVRYEL